ncbi:alpha/beta hydrolase [Xylanimonas oleitrophica]|uniref:Alpha/beta hydrolase n=2 Tax=Xylanimonas oleitrophica TaxID=2607479 RepID=A0A2W5WNU5_9MICO|nr:alpha/beta hydrolase [Xylanimonas oleitrophica]
MDTGGDGPVVVLLHGLAGSGRELLPTAEALSPELRVLVVDQRGHGASTRRPADVSRAAFVADVVTVVESLAPGRKVCLVGQSMGAHTAFLVAHARPDLVDRLVMLEGHVRGGEPGEAARLGAWFASWPLPFAHEQTARAFLGPSPLTEAWVADLERTPAGLRPRFDADVMEAVLAAVHEPRWEEWRSLTVPTLAVFAENGMFTVEQQDELVAARAATERAVLRGAGHDAHLDVPDAWTDLLRRYLLTARGRPSPAP